MPKIWDRARGNWTEEVVYGDRFVQACYGTALGRGITHHLFAVPQISKIYGLLQSSKWSGKKVAPFIRDFSIPMEEYEERKFSSFNDFFIRKFRKGARTFDADPSRLPAFAEGRYLGFEKVEDSLRFPLKGAHVTAEELIGEEEGKAFRGGALLIARLCPVDYHRFHFPDDGRVLRQKRIAGSFHSVNPVALSGIEGVFRINERYVSILETQHFGRLAYVEVGALMVGRIVQSHPALEDRNAGTFRRGDEKGYFLFGASSVLLLAEKGSLAIDPDVLQKTREGTESLVRLGEGIATSLSSRGA